MSSAVQREFVFPRIVSMLLRGETMLSSQWCRRATLFVLLVLLALSHFGDHLNADEASPVTLSERVTVEIYEGLPDKRSWEIEFPAAVERYELPAFGVVCTPKKYSRDGVLDTRPYPFLVSLAARIALPAGEHRLLLRSRNAARLLIDGRPVTETAFLNPNASGHEHVPKTVVVDNRLPPLPAGQQESVVDYLSDGMPHEIRLLAIVGGNKLRPEIGEVFVAVMTESEPPQLLSPGQMPALSTENWSEYVADCYERQHLADRESRHHAATEAATYWTKRHEIARLEMAKQADVVPPPVKNVSAVNNAIDKFIIAKLEQAGIEPAPLTDDEAFLRRVTLDVVGVIPTPAEIASFASVATPRDRRPIWISKLLMDHRWADHWMGYWQDVLAENPGILKPTLNNTGPFRWWIHESFSDNKPFDQFVTELIRMDGGQWSGGPAGFAMATQNDAPMAAKAHVLAKAFLGIEMQCARCHDAPFHPFKQHELFSLAAMLSRKPEKVPATSSVVLAERSRRPLIEVTLEPGVPVDPNWPFASLASAEFPSDMLRATDDSREKLAAIITSPWNSRFAQVIVNRLWQRYLGMGLVEPVDDWNDAKPSHPELLDFLARELVQNDYDLKHVARLILESQTYQRAVKAAAQPANGEAPIRLFASPVRRRLSAEQVIDSLFVVAGKEIRAEELTMDPEGRRPVTEMQNLGVPSRAWEFTSLSNERDRPALSLPVAQSVVDVLTSFGWRESRQNPLTVREEVATPAQPMIVANGVVGNRITRFSEDSALTELALTGPTPESLTTSLFRQVLSRDPSAEELGQIANVLRDGYSQRIVDSEKAPPKKKPRLSTAVSWSNHLSPEATKIKLELEQAAREGDAPTKRLKSEWRERAEDVVWALLNSPEFIFVP